MLGLCLWGSWLRECQAQAGQAGPAQQWHRALQAYPHGISGYQVPAGVRPRRLLLTSPSAQASALSAARCAGTWSWAWMPARSGPWGPPSLVQLEMAPALLREESAEAVC